MYLIWAISRLWLLRVKPSPRLGPWLFELPPLLGALLATVCWPMWMYSTITEVYTLTSAGLLGAVYLTSRWIDLVQTDKAVTHRQLALLAGAGTLFGLAGSAHHVTAALALPGLCYLVGAHQPRRAVINIATCAAPALVVGAFFYLVFMVQVARADPIWSWGGVKTWDRLFDHVIGRQYSVNLFGNHLTPRAVRLELLRTVWMFVFSYTPACLCLAVASLMRPSALSIEKNALLLFSSLGLAFVFVYIIAEDKEGYFMTLSWSVALAFALASHEVLAHRAAASSLLKASVVTLLLASPLLAMYQNWTHGGCFRPQDRRAQQIVDVVTSNLPQNAFLMLKDFQVYSPWLYLHHVEKLRPDVIMVDSLLVMRSWYLDYLQRHAAPLMNSSAVKTKVRRYRKLLALFEDQKPYDGNKIQEAYLGLLNALFAESTRSGREVFYLPQGGQLEQGVGVGYAWVPHGLALIGVPGEKQISIYAVERLRKTTLTIQQYPPDFAWIRHAWDIEGFKLKSLFVQSLAKQQQMVGDILRVQDQQPDHQPAVFTEEDFETIKRSFDETQDSYVATMPLNVKLSLSSES